MPNSYGSWRTGAQIDNIYPVGSIYISVNSTNPRDLFGGTWEAVTGGRFLISQNSTYTAGSTGGSATMAHTHSQVAVTTGASSAANSGGPSNNTSGSTAISVAQMPQHNHAVFIFNTNNQDYDAYRANNSGGWTKATYGGRLGTISWQSAAFKTAGANYSGIGTGDFMGNTDIIGSGSGHTHTLSSHTHTIAHTHSISATTTGAASNTNNMPPYLSVYMWKRIA